MNTQKDIMSRLISEMVEYERGTPRRVGHLLKVYGFAKTIGELEGLDEHSQFVLEIAAILHDIGIKPSIEKYQAYTGHYSYQEIEGPPVAGMLLKRYNMSDEAVERVQFLIANHHTYGSIQAIDYQILIEADFLVNIHEKRMERNQIESIFNNHFKTKTGKMFLEEMFLREDSYD